MKTRDPLEVSRRPPTGKIKFRTELETSEEVTLFDFGDRTKSLGGGGLADAATIEMLLRTGGRAG